MAAAGLARRDDGLAWARFGVVLWILLVSVVAVSIAIAPTKHSVVMHYMHATGAFWRGEPLYNPAASNGFLYLPSFAVAFTAFWGLGSPTGDVVWRLVQAAVLGYALWRGAGRVADPERRFAVFGFALLFAFPGADAAIQNGQSTTLLVAATILAFDAAHDDKPMRAAAWACLAVLAKPLGIVVWLLIAVRQRRAIPWLAVFLAILLLAPYAFQSRAYVDATYRLFAALMANISPETARPQWNDLMAIPQAFGLSIDPLFAYALRALAAVGTAALVWRLPRRDGFRGAVVPAALACGYMLLFNPRSELNSYLMMSTGFGLTATLIIADNRASRAGWTMAIACIALGFTGLATWLFNPWFNPTLLIVALGALAVWLYHDPVAAFAGRSAAVARHLWATRKHAAWPSAPAP